MLGPDLRVVVGEHGQVDRKIFGIRVSREELDWVTWAVRGRMEIRITQARSNMGMTRYQTRVDSEDDWEWVVLNLVRRPSGIAEDYALRGGE